MNENMMAIISQSVSTTVMNLLLFLFYRKIYEPKFQSRIVYIIAFIGEIIKAYNAKYESELMQTQSKMQFEHYAEINRKYEESRSVLESLTAIEGNKKAEEYREVIENEVDSLFSGFQCSNQILSIIMSQKIMVAESEDIKVNTEVEDIMFDFISDIDITAIFANLWDNAIEACRKVEPSERFVNIIIGRVNDFVVISFENAFDGVLHEKGGKLFSTKEQHEGVGVSIIKSSVEKYKGTLVI